MTFVVLLLNFASQLWGREVPIDQLFVVCILTCFQVFVGGIIWVWVSKSPHLSQIEFFGVGLAIGSIICTVVDQVLVALGFRGLGTILTFSIIALIYSQGKIRNQLSLSSTGPELTSIVCLAVSTVLATDESFTSPSMLLWLVAVVMIHVTNCHKRKFGLLLFSALVGGFLTHIYLSAYSLGRGPLLPLFTTAADDQIKSEQLAFSIARWGLLSNSAAVDLPIKFHWMSLAWAGSLMQIGGIEPFVVTLHAVPLLAFTGLAALAVTISERLNAPHWISLCSPLVLLLQRNPDGDFGFYFVVTTTNLVPHLWILALVVLIIQQEKSSNLRILLSLSIIPGFIILGKGPYGVVVGLGICVLMISELGRRKKMDGWLVIGLGSSILLMGCAYILYLRSPLTDTYYFSLSELIERFPFPLPTTQSSVLLRMIVGLSVIAVFAVLRFSWAFALGRNAQSRIERFLLFGSIGGLASFLLKQIGSETYFVNASLLLAAVGSIILLTKIEPVGTFGVKFLILVFLLVLVLVVVRHFVPDVRALMFLSISLAVLLSIVNLKMVIGSFAVVLATSSLLVSVANGFASVKFRHNVQIEIVGKDELRAFQWIREETPKDTILITNRNLCEDSVRCGSGMPVAAALTRRRFLIEGARTLTPTKMWDGPYPRELVDAVRDTLDFARLPDADSTSRLLRNGVTYALIYKDPSNQNSAQFLDIAYSAGNVAVVRLPVSLNK